jgi:hypothetical protein
VLADCSKRAQSRGAREIDERKRTPVVRWSEAIERNEGYESFSAVWSGHFVNAPRMNAVGADQCAFHSTAEISSNPLKIGAPRTFRFVVGVTHVVADRAPFTADGTNSRHRN